MSRAPVIGVLEGDDGSKIDVRLGSESAVLMFGIAELREHAIRHELTIHQVAGRIRGRGVRTWRYRGRTYARFGEVDMVLARRTA